MPDRVLFYFDPICPWSYQTSRWVRRLEELGIIEVDWGLFSLELQNAGTEPEELASAHARSALALRTAVAVREAAGATGVGRFYKAIGRRVHERGEPVEEPATVTAALEDAGLDVALCERALQDPRTLEQVTIEHRELRDRSRSFGVPTIVLDGGEGRAIFGPVISEVPIDDDAVELWRHVSWLVGYDDFSELKRERVAVPDLESVRRRHAAGPAGAPADQPTARERAVDVPEQVDGGAERGGRVRRRAPAQLAWDSRLDAARMFLRGATLRSATPIALVVGTWLSAMNQGSAILDGRPPWLKIALNYLTPLAVASLGFLAARRRRNLQRLAALLDRPPAAGEA